jgi:hypothetical protein
MPCALVIPRKWYPNTFDNIIIRVYYINVSYFHSLLPLIHGSEQKLQQEQPPYTTS